jgi:hypothetical protein
MSSTEWTNIITDAIKDRMVRSEEHKISHIVISNRMTRIYNGLTMCGISIGPVISIISGSDVCNANNNLVGIIAGLGLVSGMVVSLIKFGKFDEHAMKHKNAADGYAELEYEIRNQLLLDESDRLSAKTYMEWSQTKFTNLFTASPLLGVRSYQIHDNETKYNFRRRISNAVIHSTAILAPEDIESKTKKPMMLKHINSNFTETMLQYELERMRRS